MLGLSVVVFTDPFFNQIYQQLELLMTFKGQQWNKHLIIEPIAWLNMFNILFVFCV